jgi:hypothetical protein
MLAFFTPQRKCRPQPIPVHHCITKFDGQVWAGKRCPTAINLKIAACGKMTHVNRHGRGFRAAEATVFRDPRDIGRADGAQPTASRQMRRGYFYG